MGMVRLMVMLKVTRPGPSMRLRPASPKTEPEGLAQALGLQNAAVLNHLSDVGPERETGWPGTTLARSEPLTPRRISASPPRTLGVKYKPDAMVKLALHCQLESRCSLKPFCA